MSVVSWVSLALVLGGLYYGVRIYGLWILEACTLFMETPPFISSLTNEIDYGVVVPGNIQFGRFKSGQAHLGP
jgi:hypothetical protein